MESNEIVTKWLDSLTRADCISIIADVCNYGKVTKENGKNIYFTRAGKDNGISGVFDFDTKVFSGFSSNGIIDTVGVPLFSLLTDFKFNGNKIDTMKFICNTVGVEFKTSNGAGYSAPNGTKLQRRKITYKQPQEPLQLKYGAFIANEHGERLYRYSVNKNYINKDIHGGSYASRDWQNVTTDLNGLISTITNGFCFCGYIKDEYLDGTGRLLDTINGKDNNLTNKHILLWDFIAIDFDNTDGKNIQSTGDHYITFENAINSDLFQTYGLLAYTSASHKNEWHKFRLIIEAAGAIMDENTYDICYGAFKNSLPIDNSTSDFKRFWYGSNSGVVYCLPTMTMHKGVLYGKN
jgi:hypothetical protein